MAEAVVTTASRAAAQAHTEPAKTRLCAAQAGVRRRGYGQRGVRGGDAAPVAVETAETQALATKEATFPSYAAR